VAEEEMASAVSGLLERKGMILLESEILGKDKALLFSGALLVISYSWNLFSSVYWTGGHWQSYFWSLLMYRCVDITAKIYEYKCDRYKSGIGMSKRIQKFTLKTCAKKQGHGRKQKH